MLKLKFFLLIILFLLSFSKNVSKKLTKDTTYFIVGSDCENSCEKIQKIATNVKVCGTVLKSCCAGSCTVGVCWGTRLDLNC